ncbi:endolytic transglycosylase MltG [Candidatus Nomurabacteria bacterium]|nr:endolytic transglycosylase MltG [Candidatus Nomurabacteria bacterium]
MSEIIISEEYINKRKKIRLFVIFGSILFILILFYFFVIRGTKIEKPIIIHISKGDTIENIALELDNKGIIRSALFLQSFIAFIGGDEKINLGDYYFDKRISLPRVAYRLARGIHNIEPLKITIPEGSNNKEIAIILGKKLPDFDTELFLNSVDNLQGRLFPDTYFFYPMTKIDEIVNLLSNTFNRKTKEILNTGYKNYNSNQILTMASIVEEESKGNGDRDIIAGILWKRLEKGMLLQVDVAPETYKIRGLPAYPITNFGLQTLAATVNPKETVYLFYLHDKDGMIHLAKTYTEHKSNIKKYLK